MVQTAWYKIEYDDTRFSKAFYEVLGIKGSDKTSPLKLALMDFPW